MFINKERIKNIFDTLVIDNICIVCKSPYTQFEKDYINDICLFLRSKDININLEHNDVLTDYYIMKEAETLIVSNSTLSWCAAYFSNKIKKCFFPEYNVCKIQPTCKNIIDNTIFY